MLCAGCHLNVQTGRLSGADGEPFHPDYGTGRLDLLNLLTVSEAITHSGLERTESRGAHYRDDLLNKNPAFGNATIVFNQFNQ